MSLDTDTPAPAVLDVDPSSPDTVLLFDLDGTLADSAPGIVAGFRFALATVGAPEPDGDLTTVVVGPPMIDTFRRIGLDEEQAQAGVAAYMDFYRTGEGWKRSSLFDGVPGMLDGLAGRRLAVATSKNEGVAQRMLTHFGVADRFEVIAGASDDGSRRAKADVVASALERLGVAAGDPALLVGDRLHDVEGAAEHGLPTVVAGWGYGTREETAGARWRAETVAELEDLLR